MADVMPDYKYERMKIERQKKALDLNKFDCELRLVEIEGEKQRLHDNIEATDKALAELDERLQGIVEA